eukprot:CAMPEP_0172538528 /NCGR_PEP_ID=MMETSP1067-20121228/9899_1 /TAXON_ID=265564 ORGANISM="Thalassiosira punctigera, Strain Tpunct2005C2" /NCGR_SAMPLE_ID=MMETSP1067 /ASSEMBLY_ACC=CAM_ASM_000444 /LENGTH=86 /DNA_ID=CAMNT_0013324037 /DNA_START=697 /DNA_END=953 /DNA_ORIENTATION=-
MIKLLVSGEIMRIGAFQPPRAEDVAHVDMSQADDAGEVKNFEGRLQERSFVIKPTESSGHDLVQAFVETARRKQIRRVAVRGIPRR